MPRDFFQVRDALTRAKRDYQRLETDANELRARLRDEGPDDGLSERLANLQRGIEQRDVQVAELEAEFGQVMVEGVRTGQLETEAGTSPPRDDRRRTEDASVAPHVRAGRDAGLRTVERYRNSGEMTSDAADNADRVIRSDRLGLDGAYLDAVGDPAYNRAFGKLLADPTTGHLRFTPEEVVAVQKVNAVEAQRGLVTGTGASGGFALPIQIDASIMLTSSGALNPVRQLATVKTLSTTEWRGVSSAGVTASYDPEASEVSDDTPTLAQPTILAEMGRAFVPFSMEVGDDWGSLQQELMKLITDGRDVLDAQMFYNGTGTDQPAGVQTGLSTTQRIQTATTSIVALADIYSIKQALPPRFMPNASWAWHPTRLDAVYRFVAAGSTTEPQIMPDGRNGPLLGKPAYEWSAIPSVQTTTTKVALYGDFKAGFTILDRLGMSAEIIQALFGATRRPTGERGLFARWRCGSKTVVPEALRYLEVL
jgi:HK97 family phage major capsid protein